MIWALDTYKGIHMQSSNIDRGVARKMAGGIFCLYAVIKHKLGLIYIKNPFHDQQKFIFSDFTSKFVFFL